MPREVTFYSGEIHERVALYITKHGGNVQTERVPPDWVFHKVTFSFTSERRIGGGDLSPIYLFKLVDGGRVLVQFIRSGLFVPGHPDDYWTTVYIYKEDDDGKEDAARTEPG